MDVNLWGTLQMTRAAVPAMIERGGGQRRDDQLDVDPPHRADLRRLRRVEGRARDGHQDPRRSSSAPHGIRVNGIFPGYIWGDSVEWYFGYLGKKRGISGEEVYQEVAGETALGYLPHSSEIAGSVLFFASDLSKPVTGQSLDVNCGHWMAP